MAHQGGQAGALKQGLFGVCPVARAAVVLVQRVFPVAIHQHLRIVGRRGFGCTPLIQGGATKTWWPTHQLLVFTTR